MDVSEDRSAQILEAGYFGLCTIASVTSYTTLSAVQPAMRGIGLQQWDYLISVLTFRICLEELKAAHLTLSEQESVFERDCARFMERFPDFMIGLDNLVKNIDRQGAVSMDVNDKAGFWLATNLFAKEGADLTGEELNLGIMAARMAAAAVSDK